MQWALIKNRVLDLRLFAERLFFKDAPRAPWGPHHYDLMSNLSTIERGKRLNVLMPRGAAKTTLLLIIYTLQRIANKNLFKSLGLPYDNFIILVCINETIANQRLRDIKMAIENIDELKDLKGSHTWRTEQLITSNDILIKGKGRGSPIRGELYGPHRPSLILIDDMEDAEELRNPDIRTNQLLWFDTDVAKAGEIDDSTDIIISDTLKHEESILATLRSRPAWKTLFYQAVSEPPALYHPTHEHLWKEWEKLYTDMTEENDDDRQKKADDFYESHRAQMTKGVKELWPHNHQLRYKNIRQSMCNEGYFPVMRELQNVVRDPSQEIFDMENAVRFKVTDDGLRRSDKRLVPYDRIAGATIFLDWAGGRDRQEDHFAAISLVLWEPMTSGLSPSDTGITHPLAKSHCYVIGAWLEKIKLTTQVEAMFELMQEHLAPIQAKQDLRIRFAVEDPPKDPMGTLKLSVQEAFKEVRKSYPSYDSLGLYFHPRNVGKVDRIAALEPSITHGWLSFNERLPEEFMRQMRQFPNAEHDDGPDSLQGATELTINKTAVETRETRSRRQYYEKKRKMFDPYGE